MKTYTWQTIFAFSFFAFCLSLFAVEVSSDGLFDPAMCGKEVTTSGVVRRAETMTDGSVALAVHRNVSAFSVVVTGASRVDPSRWVDACGFVSQTGVTPKMSEALVHVVGHDDAAIPPPRAIALAELVELPRRGKTRDEIAIILGIGAETVKARIKTLMRKLDVPNAPGAVSRAYELGILRV